MKKSFKKLFMLITAIVFSISLFAACQDLGPKGNIVYDSGVVKAFNAVTPKEGLISQTAVANGSKYLVTVITSSSVMEYGINSDFTIENTNEVLGEAPALIAMTMAVENENVISDLERAYEKALELSGIDRSEVEGFDFDRDTYMGKSVFKVEIEDATAKYSYIFKVDDLSVLSREIELKNASSAGNDSSYIGEAKAKTIAFEVVNIEESEAANIVIKSILNEGRKLYKIGFDYNGFRYDIDIDAINGNIIKYSKCILDQSVSQPDIPDIITEKEAKDIAVNFAFPEGLGDRTAKFRKVKLDYEDGKFIYEVEFVVENNEYEFEISASDGSIIDVEIEGVADDDRLPQNNNYITRDQAIEKVLKLIDADALVLDVEIEKEYRNGKKCYYYEIEVKIGNKEVEYYVDALTGEVTLNEEYGGNPVAPQLTEEEAMQIALDAFNISSEKVTSHTIKLEREDGRLCYEIKFYVGNIKYSITINANNGNVLEKEYENKDDDDEPPQGSMDKFLSSEQAIAELKKVLGENITIKEIELDDEGKGSDRRYYYEVEVIIDGIEYEYYVDAITGDVKMKGEIIGSGKTLIGEKRAIEIALAYFTLSENEAKVIKVKLEEDDGILIYEVKIKVKDMKYTFEIDAETGKVLDKDISFD